MDSHAKTSTDTSAKKPKKKGLIIGLSVLLVALLGGGGYFFMKKKPHQGHGDEAEQAEHGEGEGDAHTSTGDEHGHAKAHGSEHSSAHDSHDAPKDSHGHGDADAHAKKSDRAKHEASHDADDEDEDEADHGASLAKNSKGKHSADKSVAYGAQEESKTLLESIVSAFESIHEKVVAMHHAEVNNERLKLENINLRQQIERIRYEGQGSEAMKFTKDLEMKLSEEAGTKVARTLASIRYKPPEHLLPVQLYTLAVTYFKGREDEKAAVLLTYLTGLEENDAFKSAKNYLLTGVTWYRLEHFELADHYLKKVLEMPKNKENQTFQAQARLWKGILSERQGKHVSAQNWLKELVDNHPNSREAGWVNGGVPAVYLDGRSTASTPKNKGLNEVDHDEAEEDDEEE